MKKRMVINKGRSREKETFRRPSRNEIRGKRHANAEIGDTERVKKNDLLFEEKSFGCEDETWRKDTDDNELRYREDGNRGKINEKTVWDMRENESNEKRSFTRRYIKL